VCLIRGAPMKSGASPSYYLWYVLAILVCCSLQLLLIYYGCLKENDI